MSGEQSPGGSSAGGRWAVLPGDLVLVRSPGLVFSAGRWLTRSAYDHVAVVTRDGQSVNIDKPRARSLSVERVLRPDLRPLVLRPAFRDEAEREAFVSWNERLVEKPYDSARTLRLLPRILLWQLGGVAVPLDEPGLERPQWICTDAVLLGLERCAQSFRTLRSLPLDWCRLSAGTTNDFLTIHRLWPERLFEPPRVH